jgi:hypothetical protein
MKTLLQKSIDNGKENVGQHVDQHFKNQQFIAKIQVIC